MRGESLVAVGRVALATLSIVAMWLDPIGSPSLARTTLALLLAYLAYALVVALFCIRFPRALSPRTIIVLHGADLGVFAMLCTLSSGASSPFFAFFTFSMAAAALRWQRRGLLWTAGTALALLVAMSAYQVAIGDPRFEVNRSIVRAAYLLVIASILGQLGALERRRRNEVAALAAWPRPTSHDLAHVLQESLMHAAQLLHVGRALLVWEDPDEPWVNIAEWNGTALRQTRESPETFLPLIHEELAATDFHVNDARSGSPLTTCAAVAGPTIWRGVPLNADFVRRFELGSVLAARVMTERMTGHLLLAGTRPTRSDDLALGSVAAQRVGDALDAYQLNQQLNEVAVLEERERLSHELHDGVLQSLAGLGFLLKRAELDIAGDPAGAATRLQEAQHLLAEEQRDIRFFVQGLRYSASGTLGTALQPMIDERAQRVEAIWGVRISTAIDVPQLSFGVARQHSIVRIAQEAMMNAARHGGASSVHVDLRCRERDLLMTITDDGHGFPFKGHFDNTALREMHLGPVTLKARVKSLGGTMTIDSSATGARLEVAIPTYAPPKEAE
jgi:signal transduction histidine kinase